MDQARLNMIQTYIALLPSACLIGKDRMYSNKFEPAESYLFCEKLAKKLGYTFHAGNIAELLEPAIAELDCFFDLD